MAEIPPNFTITTVFPNIDDMRRVSFQVAVEESEEHRGP